MLILLGHWSASCEIQVLTETGPSCHIRNMSQGLYLSSQIVTFLNRNPNMKMLVFWSRDIVFVSLELNNLTLNFIETINDYYS